MRTSFRSVVYFILSTIITYIFIAANPVYNSLQFRLLALGIAGLVWGLQVLGALLFLGNKKIHFLNEAGKVCLTGSLILMIPVLINLIFTNYPQLELLISGISVLASVTVMAFMFGAFLKRLQLSYGWLEFWLLCLCIAVPVQAWLVGIL